MAKVQHMLEFSETMKAGIYELENGEYIVSFKVPFEIAMKMITIFIEHEKSKTNHPQ